ncbi:hypothetical protein ACQKLP_17775 [Chitinophaga sp. NPDC101104]|uniref:hypothetical protein n=1 Tax=Chitinophaga sp. NPDC101104 TaxID=3390561 RepID=UPI003D0819B7
MTEHQIAFDSHFATKGGLFVPAFKDDNLNEYFKWLLIEFSWQKRNYGFSGEEPVNPPFVNTEFINALSLNAYAGAKDGNYFIGINAATVILVTALFNRMLANPNILTSVGDPLEEEPGLKVFNPEITHFDQLYLSSEEILIFPKNEVRRKFAFLLARTALNFLHNHEYAHIILGHVDYSHAERGVFELAESEQNIGMNNLDVQTLELDADIMATYMGLKFINFANLSNANLDSNERSFYTDWQNGTFNFSFAVYSLFRLFGFKNHSTSELLNFDHPPEGVRQVNIFNTILKGYTDAEKYQQVPEICFLAAKQVEFAFQEMAEKVMSNNAIKFAFNYDVLVHTNLITNNWNNLIEKLKKYCFVPLKPYVERDLIDVERFRNFDADLLY